MAVREIVTVGHEVLRQRCIELALEELCRPDTQRLIDDMIDTMRAAGGAGIAANQVGETARIAIAEVTANHPRYPYKPPIALTVMVNPTIEPLDAETERINEGCLSVPDLRGTVERYLNIRVRHLDREGNEQVSIRRGLTAGTFQHEVDHLNGMLFLDRVQDTRTFTTWEQFNRFHRDAFVEHAREIVARTGS
jgi:peptide deformylase